MVDLESGDLLLLMTNGNANGSVSEVSGRLDEVLSSTPIEMPIEEVADTIINDVEDYRMKSETMISPLRRSKPQHLQFTPILQLGNTLQLESKTKAAQPIHAVLD